MFQYAASRALALAHKTSLKLDISGFSSYKLHQGFELDRIFNCFTKVAEESDIRSILGWQSPKVIRRLVSRPSMSLLRNIENVVEPHFQYWLGIKQVPCDCYLTGYWQSEKYFEDVAGQIRNDFTFKLPLEGRNVELVDRLKQVNAVSLHVRRGDYVSNINTAITHGVCSLEYYHTAIKYVAERVEQPVFVIFSDDIAWVKYNLKTNFPCLHVNHNHELESYNDMRLMSLCQHHIIANSSFSWWGAWLNQNPDKIVVAPKRWFVKDTNTQDLYPLHWVRL